MKYLRTVLDTAVPVENSESSGQKQPGSLKPEGWIRGHFLQLLHGWLGVCLHTSFDGNSLLAEAVHASVWAKPI